MFRGTGCDEQNDVASEPPECAREEGCDGDALPGASRGPLTVISGPVFEPKSGQVSYRLVGQDEVAVPTHFFKIVVDARAGQAPQALAFLIPNAAPVDKDLNHYLVSIDEIERLTGIDFLSALPDQEEEALEAGVAGHVW